MNLLSWIRAKVIPPALVSVDGSGVNYKPFMGRSIIIRWADLSEVSIETTDKGPYAEDFFAVLKAPGVTVRIPQEVQNFDALLVRLQKLPRFNNEAVIEAMGSAQNATFPCWKKGA